MPEGHSIHRYARLHREAFAGRRLRCWSPQGRFTQGAALLDGQVLHRVEPAGKHLFYRFDSEILHVHLGLVGTFRTFAAEVAPPATAGTRLAWRSEGDDAQVLHLAGAIIVALVTPHDVSTVKAALGPDPLDRRADPERFLEGLRRRSVPIGHALLDQKLVAGLGNVYRAELLFLAGIHPATPAPEVSEHAARALWTLAVEELRAGARTGRIVTVRRGGRRVTRGGPHDARYVYRRGGLPCHVCATPIATWLLGGRRISHCPTCQPLPPPDAPGTRGTVTRSGARPRG